MGRLRMDLPCVACVCVGARGSDVHRDADRRLTDCSTMVGCCMAAMCACFGCADPEDIFGPLHDDEPENALSKLHAEESGSDTSTVERNEARLLLAPREMTRTET